MSLPLAKFVVLSTKIKINAHGNTAAAAAAVAIKPNQN